MASRLTLLVFVLLCGCGPDPLVGTWYMQDSAGFAELDVEASGALRLGQGAYTPTAGFPRCVVQRYRAGTWRNEGGELVVSLTLTVDSTSECAAPFWQSSEQHRTETWTYSMNGSALGLIDASGAFVGAFRQRE